MKKKLVLVLIVIIVIFGFIYFNSSNNNLENLLKDVEEDTFNIDEYSIFGTHLSISGCIDGSIDEDLELVLKNHDDEINIKSTFYKKDGNTCFYLSEKNNDGLNLDELNKGEYLLLVKSKKDDKSIYYTLKNNTKYKNLEYYTITKNNSNNKINIDFNDNNKKEYVSFNIKEEKLPDDVYDIVIDPGHGGNDSGASTVLNETKFYESNITLEISLLLKERLEKLGLKVKLTRDKDIYLDPYGEEGRAVMPNKYNSKYSLSLHINSAEGNMKYGGVEVYTPNNINYDLATLLSDNISKIVNYSKKPSDKIANGIYYTYFTSKDIEESRKEMLDKNMKPYDIKENAPYMYMIREVGGVNTFAYIDGRNDIHGINKYYNSNKTAEPYLIELGYMKYSSDLEELVNNPEKFVDAISSALKEYLKIS